jgi:tRNA (cytidine/uridine-2'-O-)-methyltransferase
VAVGARLWLVRPLGFHLGDRHRRRAGLDYWDHLSWQVVDAFQEVAESPDVSRLWLFSTRGDRLYTEASYRPGDALVFGSESQGLPASLLDAHPGSLVRIPMHAEARSLNLAVAVAVAAYEALRQMAASGSLRALGGVRQEDVLDRATEEPRDLEGE